MFRACEACGGWPAEHPQEHLVAGGLSSCVDRELVPLLRICWTLGLLTYASCEDYLWSGRALLEFLSADGAQEFLSRVMVGSDQALRRRILEGSAEDGWSVQASLRELRIEGVQPVLRMGLQVLLPVEDVERAVVAMTRAPVEVEDDEEVEDEPWEPYDSTPIEQIVQDVVLRDDADAWRYLLQCVELASLSETVKVLSDGLLVLPHRPEVPSLAHLALSAFARAQRDAPAWEIASTDDFRQWVQRCLLWWSFAADQWDPLRSIDDHAPFGATAPDPVDESGELRLELINYEPTLFRSFESEASAELFADLWTVLQQVLGVQDSIEWLDSHGCFPHGDPRSPVHRRAQLEAKAAELRMHLDESPVTRTRQRLISLEWPYAVAVTHLADGRHLQLRNLDGDGGAVEKSVSEGTREEYANLAFDALMPPPTMEGWACRMVLGDGRKPARVEFLEFDASWQEVRVTEIGVGDVVRLPGSRYAWQISDVHAGDDDAEVQLELAAPGLPTFAVTDQLERWAPEPVV